MVELMRDRTDERKRNRLRLVDIKIAARARWCWIFQEVELLKAHMVKRSGMIQIVPSTE